MNKKEHIYTLELTERQAKLLSYVCDQFPRLIEGQDWSYQQLFEAAWERRCKEAVGGNGMDDKWDGGWKDMRLNAEELCKVLKKRFWGLDYSSLYGIHYDDAADIIWDLHRVIRFQLWKDDPERCCCTVDSEKPIWAIGSEQLAVIKRK